jgi:hypothetical protein
MDLIEAISRPIASDVEWSNDTGTRLTLTVPELARNGA